MRWDCERDGCFNLLRRPKIEVFADCFPRRINFGDVDGMVELCGCFCILEWKGPGGSVREGQARSYAAFTAHEGNLVLIVHGDAETMEVQGYSSFWDGRPRPYHSGCLDDVKERLRAWCEWVQEEVSV